MKEAQHISLPDHTAMSNDDSCSNYEEPLYDPKQFNQSELNDLVWDLCLSKDQSEILALRIQENYILDFGAKVRFNRTREDKLIHLFSKEEDLVFCNDIGGLLGIIGVPTYSSEN